MTSYDKLRELAENATPGPWIAETAQDGDECGPLPNSYVTGEVLAEYPADEWNEHPGADLLLDAGSAADAEFIAAANPATVLALLDELDALRRGRGQYAGRTGGSVD